MQLGKVCSQAGKVVDKSHFLTISSLLAFGQSVPLVPCQVRLLNTVVCFTSNHAAKKAREGICSQDRSHGV